MAHRFWDTVRADLVANRLLAEGEPAGALKMLRRIFYAHFYAPHFMCVLWYRINRYLYERKVPIFRFLNARRRVWFGNDIPCFAVIGPGLRISHMSDIVISTEARIGSRVTIYNGVTLGAKWIDREHNQAPVVGDDVIIFTGAKLLGGLTIGDRSVVGALTLCDKDVPADSVVYGIPPNRKVEPRKI